MSIATFTYAEGVELRTVADKGQTFACLADLAHGLDIKNVTQLKSRIPDALCRTYPITDSLGRTQQATFVTEAGMNMVIWRSDKPEAIAYAQWCAERIAELNRHGITAAPATVEALLADPDTMIRILTDLKAERAKRAELETTVSAQQATMRILEPKASAYDRWLSSNPDYSADIAAKALAAAGADTGRNRLLAHMGKSKEHGGLGMIFRQGKFWHPYQHETERGRLTVKLGRYEDSHTGEVHPTSTVRITAKGIEYLAVQLGVLPADVAAHLEAMENAA